MDILSDVLRAFRLSARVYLHASFCGAWAVDASGGKRAPFHAIAKGNCWLHLPGEGTSVPLGAGDLVVFPHDHPHLLAGSPEPPGPEVPRNRPAGPDDEGPFTTLICGYFDFERHAWNPLLEALPAAIVVRAGDPAATRRFHHTLLQLMAAEVEAEEPGGKAVVDRLAETLFVHVLRTYLRQQRVPSGYLAAMVDRNLGRALAAIHERPHERWTVERLARVAGQSRSVFAERFQRLTGMTPLAYLTRWRMQQAYQWLTGTHDSVARIAERCGYESYAAFAKAFKRHTGLGPGAVRRNAGLASRASR